MEIESDIKIRDLEDHTKPSEQDLNRFLGKIDDSSKISDIMGDID